MTDPNRDQLLSHEVDGIREFDNALPRWWLYGFYFTIVLGVGYFANYHVLATPLFGSSSIAEEYKAEVAAAVTRSARASHADGAGVIAPLTDAASLAKGEAIFMSTRNLCHTCHRPDLGGIVGPNLTDNLWLHGCTAAEMVKTVRTGFPPKGMLPFGSGQQLTDDEVLAVVSFVISKRGSNPASPKPIDPERDKECR
ncbi:MAG TPA: cbb3-type cytochrome c oxidase N-terminal domain-containing protein [Vicinamibacterales bacterium]|nr:cbb3-type cytochrome c oxidase N-terminal domain-containing protein [Vicinamibacterales bacterium]